MEIKTADELLKTEMPEVSSLWGDLLREKSRIALVAQPKMAKSFFVMQLGLCIAAGEKFLGMETQKSKVLYVNFELSEEKLQERVQDMVAETRITEATNFATYTPGERISLDTESGFREFDELMTEAGINWGKTDLVIIDPRSHSMEKDENQSEVLGAWCSNIDKLRKEWGFTTLIVHHLGKATTGMGRGSSVFDGWVDGALFLKRPSGLSRDDQAVPTRLTKATLSVQSRDSESRAMSLNFEYPKWRLSDQQFQQEKTKVESCVDFVRQQVEEESIWQLNLLRTLAMREGHTDYAFKRSMKQLESDKFVEIVKDSDRQGNYKLVRLLTPVSVTRSPE